MHTKSDFENICKLCTLSLISELVFMRSVDHLKGFVIIKLRSLLKMTRH